MKEETPSRLTLFTPSHEVQQSSHPATDASATSSDNTDRRENEKPSHSTKDANENFLPSPVPLSPNSASPPLSPHRCFSIPISILIFLISAILLFFARPDEETQNYHNADTPYHVLLTLNSWKNQPVSAHMFVPSVTLYPEDAKDFTWGATLPHKDGNGNFFYTSFPPLSFVLPYVWFSSTGLPINAGNLQIFSILLSLASCAVLALLLKKIFPKIPGWFCSLVAVVFGVFARETLHVSTSIYWAHVPYQLTFLLQLYFFAKFREKSNVPTAIVFIFISFFSCLIEWTAYVGNFGFLLLFLFYSWNGIARKYLPIAALLSLSTLAALGLILWHISLVLDIDAVLETMPKRYEKRSLDHSSSRGEIFLLARGLFVGYAISFYSILFSFSATMLLFVTSLIYNMKKNGRDSLFKMSLKIAPFLFLPAFILAENVFMCIHATLYSFDRIKSVILFAILFCFLVSFLMNRLCSRKLFGYLTFILLFSAASSCWHLLARESSYRWKYPLESSAVTKWIGKNFDRENSTLCLAYRYGCGHLNLSVGRDYYEHVFENDEKPNSWLSLHGKKIGDIMKETKSRGKRWLVLMRAWRNTRSLDSMTAKPIFTGVTVYDIETGEQKSYTAAELSTGMNE